MLYNHSLAFSQKSQLTDHYLTSIMYLIMHLFCTARDITSHALGTIMSSMGPYGVLGALGTSAMTYLLLQMLLADDSTSPRGRRASPQAADGTSQHHPTPSKHLYAHRHPATEKMVTYRQEMVAQGRPIEQGSCTGNRG